MDFDFSSFVDGARIVAADATAIPAPPNSSHPGEHLLVNGVYSPHMSQLAPQILLDEARKDTLEMLRITSADPRSRDFVSVVATIYGQIQVPQAARTARRRIYRMNVLLKDLVAIGTSITAESLSHLDLAESSELDEVEELLQQTASR